MLKKYDLLSYFFSITINLVFFLLFFTSFNFKHNKIEKIKVKLISSAGKSLQNFNLVSQSKLDHNVIDRNISKKKKIIKKIKKKRNDSKINENLLRKRIAQIKKRINSKKKISKSLQLSKQELKVLKEKLLALQRIEKMIGQNSHQKVFKDESVKNKASTTGTQSITRGLKGTLQKGLSLDYLLLVKEKLQNNFEVPVFLKNKKGLYAIVSIEVSSRGDILQYKFLKKSPVREFNQAVERCLKISSPLPVDKKAKIVVEFKSEGIGSLR